MLRDLIKSGLRGFTRRLGYDVVSYSHMRNHELRRAKLLKDLGITLVVDGGANVGQFGSRLRKFGYRGRIVSIEPLEDAFVKLAALASEDPAWSCIQAALGERCGTELINVAGFDQVSSILLATGAMNTAGWTGSRQQPTEVITLDSLVPELARPGEQCFLKLDVQGYESRVLEGARVVLKGFAGVEMEFETVPLYEGAALAPEMIKRLSDLGFSVFSLEPSVVDFESGRVIEIEGLFVRSGSQS